MAALAIVVAVLVGSIPLAGMRLRALTRTVGDRPSAPTPADPVVVLDLVAVAVEAGADIPHALDSVGAAVGGATGEELRRVGVSLLLGAAWSVAWTDASEQSRAVADALATPWADGTSAVPTLRATAQEMRRDRRRAGREAASRLGVRLVLPLGVCLLPAFVLTGVVPLLISLAGRLAG